MKNTTLKDQSAGMNSQNVHYINAEPMKQTNSDTIVVPGFTESQPTFDLVISQMVEKGRRIFSVTNDHGISAAESKHIPRPQQRKASALVRMMHHEHLENTDALAHSEGGVVLAGAAMDHPEYFKKMVLYAPAGLKNGDNVFSLGLRTFQEKRQWKAAKEELIEKNRADLLQHWERVEREALRYLRDGLLKSMFEILGIARARIGELLKTLQGDHGVKIAILAPEFDRMYPLADTPELVTKLTDIPDRHLHVIPGGTHVAHMQDPEGFANYVEHAFAMLDE